MKLSTRLHTIFDMVQPCGVAADIGCDHGLLPIALIQSGKCEHVYACDVRKGPLSRAQEAIRQYGLQNSITTKLCDGLQGLDVYKRQLQEGVKYFPDDMISDHGENFQIAEIIREKVLYKTNEEVPHSVAVIVEKKEESDTRMELSALIVVERSSQKSILIGKQGAMIRGIRLAAQKELKEKFGKKVELELYVRVEKNWRNRSSKLHQLGYLELEEGR